MKEIVYRCDICGEIKPMYRLRYIRKFIFHYEIEDHNHICDDCMNQIIELRKAKIAMNRGIR